jgi:hypothetical protein
MIRLQRPAELSGCLRELFADPSRCRQMGAAGRRVVAENRGASERLLALVTRLLAEE